MFVTSSVNADFTIYTVRAEWEAAVASFQEEFFDDAVLNTDVSVVSDLGYVTGGLWSDVMGDDYDLGNGQPDHSVTTWMFDPEIYAFGGNWSSVDYGISVLIGGTYLDIPAYGDFWGVVSTVPFNTVLLQTSGYGPGIEHYELDNMVYGTIVITVDIDIKFGSFPNSINLKSKKGVTPVAVFGSADFEVTDIDPETVRLAGVLAEKWSIEDLPTEPNPEYVDPGTTPEEPEFIGDGFDDMVFYFSTPALRGSLTLASVEATLTGETENGFLIEGTDSVRIIKY
jgi:hypothetical protein